MQRHPLPSPARIGASPARGLRLAAGPGAPLLRLALTAALAFCLAIAAIGARAEDAASSADAATAADPTTTAPTPDGAAPREGGATVDGSIEVGAREAGLRRVLEARRQIQADLEALQAELRSEAARGREAGLESQIRARAAELAELERNFSELAAGVDPLAIEGSTQEEQLDLMREVRDLLGPLVNELKRATSRPREIDRLRTEIGEQTARLARVQTALDRLDQTAGYVRDDALKAAIEAERASWIRRKSALSASLQVTQQKLDRRLGESQSISQAIENVFQLFFKSRGRNLLLALVATIGFLYAIRRLRRFVAGRALVSRRADSFEGKVLSLVSTVFTVLGAILVFLVSLYFFGDWVLLILVLLLILGLIWTSKQAIPRFWTQSVLILGMGAVREHERVVLDGLPWRVDSISFYSELSNPSLVGGSIRLPIDDLAELRSRPWHEDEPWFPTEPGDVVLLEDGRPAVVEFQSIERVRLRTPGNNRHFVPAADFAGGAIEKLSDGYRIAITFGLDYGDQAGITTTMRDTLHAFVQERWRECRWSESVVSTAVEFKEAGASSLDMFVRVDLDGSDAFDYATQCRALARDCVDCCNENGWVIPFTQLTLHMAEGSGAEAASTS